MVDSKIIENWLEKAKEDLEASKILFNHNGPRGLAAFHSQQAIEKAYKAYLLNKAGEFAEGHSLTFLNKQCVNFDKDFDSYKSDSAKLNKYYIKTRYPADIPLFVSDEETSYAIKVAEELLAFINNKISK